jgi:hypothetical protein
MIIMPFFIAELRSVVSIKNIARTEGHQIRHPGKGRNPLIHPLVRLWWWIPASGETTTAYTGASSGEGARKR